LSAVFDEALDTELQRYNCYCFAVEHDCPEMTGGNPNTGLRSYRLLTQPSIIFGDFVSRCVPQYIVIRPNAIIDIESISLLLGVASTTNKLEQFG